MVNFLTRKKTDAGEFDSDVVMTAVMIMINDARGNVKMMNVVSVMVSFMVMIKVNYIVVAVMLTTMMIMVIAVLKYSKRPTLQ